MRKDRNGVLTDALMQASAPLSLSHWSFRSVIRWVASGLFSHFGLGCAGHLPLPLVKSALHPGRVQGLGGFLGIRLPHYLKLSLSPSLPNAQGFLPINLLSKKNTIESLTRNSI